MPEWLLAVVIVALGLLCLVLTVLAYRAWVVEEQEQQRVIDYARYVSLKLRSHRWH